MTVGSVRIEGGHAFDEDTDVVLAGDVPDIDLTGRQAKHHPLNMLDQC